MYIYIYICSWLYAHMYTCIYVYMPPRLYVQSNCDVPPIPRNHYHCHPSSSPRVKNGLLTRTPRNKHVHALHREQAPKGDERQTEDRSHWSASVQSRKTGVSAILALSRGHAADFDVCATSSSTRCSIFTIAVPRAMRNVTSLLILAVNRHSSMQEHLSKIRHACSHTPSDDQRGARQGEVGVFLCRSQPSRFRKLALSARGLTCLMTRSKYTRSWPSTPKKRPRRKANLFSRAWYTKILESSLLLYSTVIQYDILSYDLMQYTVL